MVNDGKEAASGRMTEAHPLEPFLPEGARLLMLGSFPPARSRWSMEFYYPNFQNDMWRVMGLVFTATVSGSSLRTDGISTGKRWRRSVGSGESPFPILRPKWSGPAAMRRTGFLRWCVRSTWPVCWKGCRRVGPWRLRDRRRPTHWLQSQGANLPRWAVFRIRIFGPHGTLLPYALHIAGLSQTVGRKGGRLREDVRRNGTCPLKDVLWGRRRASEPRPEAESRRAEGRGCRPFGKGMFCRIVIFILL